jgi:hypothetical protein
MLQIAKAAPNSPVPWLLWLGGFVFLFWLWVPLLFPCTRAVNILSFCLYCQDMFRPNQPSSGVQVVVMKESAAYCNAVLLILCSFRGLILGYAGRSALVCLMVLLVCWFIFGFYFCCLVSGWFCNVPMVPASQSMDFRYLVTVLL